MDTEFTENSICGEKSSNGDDFSQTVLVPIGESNRDCPEENDIPTPLEDILKNVYDLNSTEKDFAPNFNSTITDGRLFNAGINSTNNNFNIQYSGDSSLYITSQNNSNSDSSLFVTADYQSTASLSNPRMESNDYLEYLMDQKMYNIPTAETAIHEEENDLSPVYLNFNLQNMAQPLQTFNTGMEKISNHVTNCEADKKNETLKYVEYLNDVEETIQATLVDSNIQRNQIFQQLPVNVISSSLSSELQKIYDVSQDYKQINGNNITDVTSLYQNLNNSFVNYSDLQKPNLNLSMQRNIIIRKPLQTKLTIKQKLSNHDWNLINNNNVEYPDEMCSNSELSSLETLVPDIPFIKERSQIRKGRKQTLAILADSEVSFMNPKGEFSKSVGDFMASIEEPRVQFDSNFVTFRKKMKPIEPDPEAIEERTLSGQQNAYKNSSSNNSVLLISSDTDSEDDIQTNEIKCLKCNNCSKMFKTARSYSIHKKRCNAPAFADNSGYVIKVEYLESEKEDIDQASESRPKRTISLRKKPIEISLTEAVESIENPKIEINESIKNNENVTIRRNTRSQKNVVSTNPGSSTCDSPKSKRSKTIIASNSSKTKVPITFVCDLCGKKFRQKSYLLTHKRSHERNFKCDYCFKHFEIRSTYITHIAEKCDKIPIVKLRKLRSTIEAR